MDVEIPSHRFALSVDEAANAVGISRPTLYEQIKTGRLRTFKVNNRRLVSPDALREWVKAQEDEEAAKCAAPAPEAA